jgi:hypothetical protein
MFRRSMKMRGAVMVNWKLLKINSMRFFKIIICSKNKAKSVK